jgi:flavin-dependent dehydrogenase
LSTPPVRDVVVVGGGPAGAATALFLRQRGHDVLLLEARRFPRDKICGEGFSPEAWRLLDALGASARVAALGPHPLRGMHLVAPDGTDFRGFYRARGRGGFALRRTVLDQALLEAAREAQVEVEEGTAVTGLLRTGAGVGGVVLGEGEAARQIRARAVVGADGRASVVARGLGLLSYHRRLRRFAVRGHWEGVEGLETLGEMHVAGGGYCGLAPLSPTRANVTFVLEHRQMRSAASGLEGFYRQTLRRLWPRIAERLDHARLLEEPRAVGPLALVCRRVSVPGAVLVGDAAGFFDPFTGEGVTLALRTAELAARSLDRALGTSGRQPLPCLLEYERDRAQATRDKFRFNRLVQAAVGWPRLANELAHRLARRPDLADLLVGIAGDFEPARSALGLPFLVELARA